MGRYYPPSDSPPGFNTTTHPLGSRARKLHSGILTVRFELPFAVWCQHCSPEILVGQGVRFNAEKKKVGTYYSTPVWSFRVKHTACGGWWEIRTDPAKSEYVVVSGARRREYGSGDQGSWAEVGGLDEQERDRRRNDAFAAFEGKKEDAVHQEERRERVEELLEWSEVWKDPYTMNQKLRKGFRLQRKAAEREESVKQALQDKFSVGFEVVEEAESDKVKAGLVEFGGQTGARNISDVSRGPMFKEKDVKVVPMPTATKKLKAEIAAEKSRLNLQQTLVGNTRANIDPFLESSTTGPSKLTPSLIPGFKRKRGVESSVDASNVSMTVTTPGRDLPTDHVSAKKPALPTALVDYDS
ncbi:DUF572-domain-containing protein, partial [Lojkania enalia]